jgi:sarcosine oxidase
MTWDVIVVGVGAMGSATLAELAARGARVLGLERAGIPNESGSSHGVHRIIRLAYFEDPRYVPILRRAYERWRALEARAGERLLVVTGGIDAGAPESRTVSGSLASCRAHDLPHEVLESEQLSRRHPGIRLPTGMRAVAQPDAGFVMSERAIAAYAASALADGAELHGHEPALAWEPDGDGVVVRTRLGRYRGRRLVISAGAWAATLVPALRGLAVPERQVLRWSQPRQPRHYAVGAFPVFNLDAPEGHLYGFPVYGVPGFKHGLYHHRREVVDPDAWDRTHVDEADEALLRDATARYFPGAEGPTLSLKTCLFTNTPDEHFVVDRHPGLPQVVVASPCSGHGFKFASAIGEIVADLALDGGSRFDLSMFRIDRFADEVGGGDPPAAA